MVLCSIWFSVPLVLWHCWLGHLTRKNPSPYDLYCVDGTLSLTQSINQIYLQAPAPAVSLAQIQKTEEIRQKQLEADEAERRRFMDAQMAEMEAIQSRRQQTALWKEKYRHRCCCCCYWPHSTVAFAFRVSVCLAVCLQSCVARMPTRFKISKYIWHHMIKACFKFFR